MVYKQTTIIMKKIILIVMTLFIGTQSYATSENPPRAGKKEARKIAESIGACTLPDGSMGKMTVVERETSYTNSNNRTSNSGSHSTSVSGTASLSLTGPQASSTASRSYNSGSNSRTQGYESTTKKKEECRPIPRW